MPERVVRSKLKELGRESSLWREVARLDRPRQQVPERPDYRGE
jgi:hypothetical protein